MNLFKVYSMLIILLVLCTYDAEGGIILLLLLKIIALKGALFFGMPLAIGSFMMGQGMGFFGGSLFGGYSMLSAAHKYHKKHVHHKHIKPIHSYKPISYVSYGPPSNGWGWGSRGSHGHKPYVVTSAPDYGAPTTHYHYYNHNEQRFHVPISQPSLLSKITKIPSLVVDTIRGKQATPAPATYSYGGDSANGNGGGWQPGPGPSSGSSSSGGYGGQNPMNTYYETADTSDKYQGLLSQIPKDNPSSAPGGVDWNQGLANLLKAAEYAKEEVDISENGGSSGSPSHYTSQIQPSVGNGNSAGGYGGDIAGSAGGYDDPSPSYGSATQYYPGAKSPSASYGGYNPELSESAAASSSYTDKQPNLDLPIQSNAYSYAYDHEGEASEESFSAVRAPNSVIEKYLEKKLKEEMSSKKTEAQRKEAAQLIAMLRQAYVQELVESLNSNGNKKNKREGNGARRARGPTTQFPEFIPFPVPNSTTAKPKSLIRLSTLKPAGQVQAGVQAQASRFVRVRAKPTGTPTGAQNSATTPAPSRSTFPFPPRQSAISPASSSQLGSASSLVPVRVPGRKPFIHHYDESASSNAAESADEPTRFVRMKSSFTLSKRRMDRSRNLVRQRRQQPALDLQALSSFTDDVKKFFLLVSLLDQDKCLQKLVCDVHTRTDRPGLTTYESNIVITFKVMNTLLPIDSEDSTTNYRKASKIGELSKSEEVCKKAYPTCTFSTQEIISMGNSVASTGNADAANPLGGLFGGGPQASASAPVESSVSAPSSDTDQETAASEIKPQVVEPKTVTAMPRV